MAENKINKFTVEQVQNIVNHSTTKKEVATKLGYSSDAGTTNRTLTKYFEDNNIDLSSLQKPKSNPVYTRETVFCKNGTIAQHSLVKWYKREENIPYKCSICGQEPFWNNKPLIMILDHINGIHNDDRLDNLRWVCPNCNYQLEPTGFKKIRVNQKEQSFCIDCGKPITKGSLRCNSCNGKNTEKKIEELPITREELKKLIRSTPFTTIGKQYGVTDNCIRKWCIKFNLPNKKGEINNISNKDWELI